MTGDRPITVVLADDQQLVRSGFRMILETQPDLEVVAEAGNGAEAVAAAHRLRPDVVLMDIRMPEVDGIEATRRLLSGGPPGIAPRVLVLTTFDLDGYVHAALRAGASGFLLKDAPREELVAAVRAVVSGETLLAPALTRRLVERFVAAPPPAADGRPAALAALTDRELDVLRLVARGLSNADIARRLYLGEATVKTHLNRILAKLALPGRVQAVVLAYETGLVRAGDPDPDD